MAFEGLDSAWGGPHAPTLTSLGGGKDQPSLGPYELLTHLHIATLQIYVCPAQTQQLAPPEPSSDSQDVQRFEAFSFSSLQQCAGLCRSKRCNLRKILPSITRVLTGR
jgi:hypothetical protein